MILAFEACGDCPSLALSLDGEVIRSAALPSGRGQTDQLPALLATLLTDTDWNSIEALATTIGPGSYTGVRACLSLVKGLALARGLPVYGLSAFRALGLAHAHTNSSHLALIDAGRGRIWGRLALDETAPINPLQVWLDLAEADENVIASRSILDELPECWCTNHIDVELSASTVVACVERLRQAGEQPVSGFDILPLYLRGADAHLSAGKSLVARIIEDVSDKSSNR